MKNRFIKLLLAAVLLGSLSPAAAQTREMDLSGEWRFQTDVMDFRRGSLSPRYNHQLQETIMLPGITDEQLVEAAALAEASAFVKAHLPDSVLRAYTRL